MEEEGNPILGPATEGFYLWLWDKFAQSVGWLHIRFPGYKIVIPGCLHTNILSTGGSETRLLL